MTKNFEIKLDEELKEHMAVEHITVVKAEVLEDQSSLVFCKKEEEEQGSMGTASVSTAAVNEEEQIYEEFEMSVKEEPEDEEFIKIKNSEINDHTEITRTNDSNADKSGMSNDEIESLPKKQGNLKHKDDRKYKCPQCDKEYSNRTNRWHHVRRIHTSLKPHKCDSCDYATYSKWDLGRHTLKHADPNSADGGAENLLRHRFALSEWKYECNQCGKKFNSNGNRTKHILRVHDSLKPHKCDSCAYASYDKSHVAKHKLRRHTGPEIAPGRRRRRISKLRSDGQFECKRCSKKFNSSKSVSDHNQRVHDKKPHVCKICTLGFATESELDAHYRFHAEASSVKIHIESPFACTECGQIFPSQASLSEHIKKSHEARQPHRPHKCSTCGKRFGDLRDLRKHEIGVHSNTRPFICEFCQKGFGWRQALSNHLKIHADLREYVCDVCSKAFNRKCHLTKHLRNVHKVISSGKISY